MFSNYIKIAMFVSFPEMIMIILLGFQLANFKYPSTSKILFVSFLQAIVAFFIMFLNLSVAFRFIIQLSSMIVFVSVFLDIKYLKAAIVVLIGAFLQGMIQSIIIPIFSKVWEVQINNLTNNFQDNILCFIPVLLISIIILLVSRKKQIHLLDIN